MIAASVMKDLNIWPYKLQTFQLIHSTFILITILGRSPQEVFLKMLFWKGLQNLEESIYTGILFN